MKTKRYAAPAFDDFEDADDEVFVHAPERAFGQPPERFATTDELAWTDYEVRQVCDEVRDHL